MTALTLSSRFKPESPGAEALLRWHRWLQNLNEEGKGGQAERARLRRATSLDELLLNSGLTSLLHQRGIPELERNDGDTMVAMAMIAGALAHCRNHDAKHSFACQLALPQEKGGKAPVSEARFNRLQKSRDHDEFYRNLVRVIALRGKTVNVLSLANSILHWCQEYRYGINRKPTARLAVNWARDYFDALND